LGQNQNQMIKEDEMGGKANANESDPKKKPGTRGLLTEGRGLKKDTTWVQVNTVNQHQEKYGRQGGAPDSTNHKKVGRRGQLKE